MVNIRTDASEEVKKFLLKIEETKEFFLKLPESDQIAIKTVYHAEVDALNAVINTKVTVIMEDTGIKAPESATGVIDRGTHFEVDGCKVSKENLEKLLQMVNSTSGNAREKAQILNIGYDDGFGFD